MPNNSNNRLETFQKYTSCLAAGEDPIAAIKNGLYVSPGRSTSDTLLARLQLMPKSSQLVIGAVGSGKTTQLLIAARELRKQSNTTGIYVDVSAHHDLNQLTPGVLVIIAGLKLGKLSVVPDNPVTKKLRKQFKEWAHGYSKWVPIFSGDEVDDGDYDQEPMERVVFEPILRPSIPKLKDSVTEKTDALKSLLAEIPSETKLTLFVDSLDRLPNSDAFESIVMQDVRALKMIGIAIAIVGPISSLYGKYRSIIDQFDGFISHPTVDVLESPAGIQFLIKVLEKRADSSILPITSKKKVAELSGGVLRDLIQMARTAGEEAFISGANVIVSKFVSAAADSFGRSLMVGLDSEDLEVLQRLRSKGTFVHTSEKHVTLIMTRRILEYRDGIKMRYALHPTIVPLLSQLAKGK